MHSISPSGYLPRRIEEVLELAVEDLELLDERLAVLLAVCPTGHSLQQQFGGDQVLWACTAVQLVLNRVLDLLLERRRGRGKTRKEHAHAVIGMEYQYSIARGRG